MRTIAVFLIACATILLVIAYQKYYNAVATAKAIADQLEGIEFESTSLPIQSGVCGFAGLVLLVAGARLLLESRRHRAAKDSESSML